MSRWYLSIFILLFAATSAFAQSSSDLKRKQQKLKEDIAYKEKLLKQIEEDSRNTQSRMKIASQKIEQREELISVLLEELGLIDGKIEQNQDLISAFEKDIIQLKDEYARMITQAYKTRNNADKVMYIFASEDFDQAYRRMKYLQQLSDYRQQQAGAIISAQNSLEKKRESLVAQREEKNNVLNSHNQEKVVLNRERQEKAKKLTQLSGQESQYKKELLQVAKQAEELRLAIKKAIEREMSTTASEGNSKGFKITPEAMELGKNFTANKGKLPWPVDKGEVVAKFGQQPHPFLNQVTVKNNGITISTTQNSRARAVFDGVVSKIIILPGVGKVVMVRHGEYISVYTNLKETFVSNGDKVKTKEEIGVIVTDKGKTEFEFQLWKGTELINPVYWIYKAR
jgi:septal ring factor EnvC (AmiA/AmiB activator)